MDDRGNYFDVRVFANHVIKYPRNTGITDAARLEEMEKLSAELAKVVPEVYSVKKEGMTLKQKRARGQKMTIDIWQGIGTKKADDLSRRIREHGFYLSELNQRNLFYDDKTGKLEVVDLHPLRKIEARQFCCEKELGRKDNYCVWCGRRVNDAAKL